MNIRKQLSIVCSLAMILTACSKKEDATLGVSDNELAFTFEGGTQEIGVTSNTGWTFSFGADWLELTQSPDKITIKAKPNETFQERTANVIVSVAGENIDQTVQVTQSGINGKVPVGMTRNGSSFWTFAYDQDNRLIQTIVNGTIRISYNAQGEISKVVKIGTPQYSDRADSVIQMFSRAGNKITVNFAEYQNKKIAREYSETITLNDKNLPARLDQSRNDNEYFTYTYDATGNLLSRKEVFESGTPGAEEKYTYDNKRGMFSSINTSKWWFIYESEFWIYNNVLTDTDNYGGMPHESTYSYTYDSCDYPQTILVEEDLAFNIEYKRF